MGNMAKSLIVMCCIGLVCGGCSSNKIIEGRNYETYGILNQEDNKATGIRYKPCWGNIIWGAVLVETIIGPIYFFGFDMFEPVGKK